MHRRLETITIESDKETVGHVPPDEPAPAWSSTQRTRKDYNRNSEMKHVEKG